MTRSLIVLVAALTLLGATPGEAELEGRFTTGSMVTTPRAGAQCMGSIAALGTSNIGAANADGIQNDKATSVVNIWAMNRKPYGTIVGYIVKTYDGTLWYEPPVDGLQSQKLGDDQSRMLANQPITFVGCFKRDLPL